MEAERSLNDETLYRRQLNQKLYIVQSKATGPDSPGGLSLDRQQNLTKSECSGPESYFKDETVVLNETSNNIQISTQHP